jgi:uncharacterized protein
MNLGETDSNALRTSNYTIYVDLPEEPDSMLLVHGYTGAYDKVSKRVATYVRSLSDGPAPKPLYGDWSPEPQVEGEVHPPTDSTLEILKRRGYLTAKAPADEEDFFERMVNKMHELQSRMMPGYIIMPTYSCNLRCAYCFQDHMRTDPAYRHLLRVMQPELVDRMFNAMPEIESRHGIENAMVPRNITFFGGEPLLAETRPIIGYIMEKAAAVGQARFGAVSNATDLEHYRELLGPGKIASIQVTLDGPPEEHDKRRIYADGSGTFAKIARNIDMSLELGVNISLRMNIDRNNIGMLPQVADLFVAQGWTRHRNFSSYTAPIHASNEKTDRKTTMTSWQLDQALDKLRDEHENMRFIGRPDDGMVDKARNIFDQRGSGVMGFKASFCSAHNRMYIFDALGDVYACWERTGDQKLRVGFVNADGRVELNSGLLSMWRERTVTSNETCRKCRYALYCGGGCAVLAQGISGNLYTNHCDGYQKRFRATVAEAYLDFVNKRQHEGTNERVCDM